MFRRLVQRGLLPILLLAAGAGAIVHGVRSNELEIYVEKTKTVSKGPSPIELEQMRRIEEEMHQQQFDLQMEMYDQQMRDYERRRNEAIQPGAPGGMPPGMGAPGMPGGMPGGAPMMDLGPPPMRPVFVPLPPPPPAPPAETVELVYLEELVINELEATRDVTVGGLVLLVDQDGVPYIQRTYTGKPPSLCPT